MSKQQPPRGLKTYATKIGLTTWAVAAPNPKAALRAWDVRENLFGRGAAKVVTDQGAVKAAMQSPGVPVPLKSDDWAGAVAYEAKQNKARPVKKAPPPAKRKPPDRALLDAAERDDSALQAKLRRLRNEVERERKALAEMEEDATALQKDADAAARRLEKASHAYEAAMKRFNSEE